MTQEEFSLQIAKPATIFEVGGFRPTDDPFASWFGKITLGLPGETWPESKGRPMIPLCQLNLTNVPFKPAILQDIAFIAVFMDDSELPIDQPNGFGWCLRAYRSLEELVPLAQARYAPHLKPFQMRTLFEPADYPCWEDIAYDVPDEFRDNYHDLFENSPGTKIGGWPTLMQGEIVWAPSNQHPANPEFAFQIDSEAKANWQWGDAGVGYFGRGTTTGIEDVWCLSWDCY